MAARASQLPHFRSSSLAPTITTDAGSNRARRSRPRELAGRRVATVTGPATWAACARRTRRGLPPRPASRAWPRTGQLAGAQRRVAVGDRARLGRIEHLEDGGHRQRRRADDPGREFPRRGQQLSAGDDLVDDSSAERFLRGHPAPGQEQFHGDRPRQQARQAQYPAGVRDDAEPGLRQAEFRVVRGDDKVGGEHQLEAAAERQPVDGGDDGLGAAVQLGEPGEAARPVVSVDGLAGGCRLEVPARAEEPVAGSGQDADPQPRVVLEPGERVVERAARRHVDGVRARPVERDDQDALRLLGPDRCGASGAPGPGELVSGSGGSSGGCHVRRPFRAAWTAR